MELLLPAKPDAAGAKVWYSPDRANLNIIIAARIPIPMCRIAATISPDKKEFSDLLIASSKSLLMQSNANPRRLQKDGWGLGYYRSGRLQTIKSPRPVYLEKGKFSAACAQAEAPLAIAHIRLASNPKKLPPEKLSGPKNTQPFSAGRILFAHNGTLNIPDDAKKAFLRGMNKPLGNNDSEVLFLMFMRQYNITGDLAGALTRTREGLLALWEKMRLRRKQWAAPYKGLNIFVSDGRQLVVLCDFALEKEIFSLLTRGWEYGRIAYAYRKDRLIVSSEPLDRGKWRKMPARGILTARVRDGAVVASVTPLRDTPVPAKG